MAKLRSGILGKASGKVSNVVASSWKGINYVREHVIPANPNSSAQQRVRSSLSAIVLVGRAIKSTFIDTYWENLVKGTANSGWAKFMGVSQKLVSVAKDYLLIRMATGDLEGVGDFEGTVSAGSNVVNVTWKADVVSNGNALDKVYCYCYVPERNFLYSQASPRTRAVESAIVPIPDVASLTGKIYVYLTLVKADGSLFSTTQAIEPV